MYVLPAALSLGSSLLPAPLKDRVRSFPQVLPCTACYESEAVTTLHLDKAQLVKTNEAHQLRTGMADQGKGACRSICF